MFRKQINVDTCYMGLFPYRRSGIKLSYIGIRKLPHNLRSNTQWGILSFSNADTLFTEVKDKSYWRAECLEKYILK